MCRHTRKNIILSVEIRYFSCTARSALLPTSLYNNIVAGPVPHGIVATLLTIFPRQAVLHIIIIIIIIIQPFRPSGTRVHFYRVGQRRRDATIEQQRTV